MNMRSFFILVLKQLSVLLTIFGNSHCYMSPSFLDFSSVVFSIIPGPSSLFLLQLGLLILFELLQIPIVLLVRLLALIRLLFITRVAPCSGLFILLMCVDVGQILLSHNFPTPPGLIYMGGHWLSSVFSFGNTLIPDVSYGFIIVVVIPRLIEGL